MKLGDVYDALMKLENNDFVFSEAFDDVMSYRGYYNEVSFSPATNVPLFVVKEQLDRAMNEEFTGYKGGEFYYNSDTPAHLAHYSTCPEDSDIQLESLVGKMLIEYHKVKVPIDELPVEKKVKKVSKRKTKAELERERIQYEQDLWEEFVRQYPVRFAKMMYEYGRRYSEGFTLHYNDADGSYGFDVDNDDVGRWDTNALPVTVDVHSENDRNNLVWKLEAIESAVEAVDQHKKVQEEKARKRTAALNKLTKEEKELLGL